MPFAATWMDLKVILNETSHRIVVSSSSGSLAQSCLTLCDPMGCSVPGFPVHHQLRELSELRLNTQPNFNYNFLQECIRLK